MILYCLFVYSSTTPATIMLTYKTHNTSFFFYFARYSNLKWSHHLIRIRDLETSYNRNHLLLVYKYFVLSTTNQIIPNKFVLGKYYACKELAKQKLMNALFFIVKHRSSGFTHRGERWNSESTWTQIKQQTFLFFLIFVVV